jgi:hypothetical protein
LVIANDLDRNVDGPIAGIAVAAARARLSSEYGRQAQLFVILGELAPDHAKRFAQQRAAYRAAHFKEVEAVSVLADVCENDHLRFRGS